jgi:imidazolonepropionase
MNVVHAKQLITIAGPARARRTTEMRDLRVIADGAHSVRDGVIEWVGATDELPDRKADAFDASGCIVMPGFVDTHTHAVFTGYRVDEFEWRTSGVPYLDILARGGGIHASVKSVCAAPELSIQAESRFLEHGTTTIEAKSGYGLTRQHEIRMLELLQKPQLLDVVPTYLGAHALPVDYIKKREDFVDEVIKDLEIVASRRLAEYCDVFVEPGAFTVSEARAILLRARDLGMGLRVHADEFENSGGARLAVELKAASADHLGAATDDDVALIARSGVIATLLPSTLFMLGSARYAPARKLIDSGAAVALASDFNPGTSPTMNMQFVMTLACTQMQMTPAESIVAATINGAAAVRRENLVGSLEPGKLADLAVFDVNDYREIPYFAALNSCVATFKRGKLLYESNRRKRS